MPFEINTTVGRDDDFQGLLEDATGVAISITPGSDILVKIYRGSPATPDLDISSTPLVGGSNTSFISGSGTGKGTYTLQLFAADMTGLTPGTYDVQVDLVDSGDSYRLKHADYGVLHLLGNPVGNVT